MTRPYGLLYRQHRGRGFGAAGNTVALGVTIRFFEILLLLTFAAGCSSEQQQCAPTPGCPSHDEILARTGISAGVVVNGQDISDVEVDCQDICTPIRPAFALVEGSHVGDDLRVAVEDQESWTFAERSFVANPVPPGVYTLCFLESPASESQAGQGEFAARCSEFFLPERDIVFATIRQHFATGVLLSDTAGGTVEKSREDRDLTVDLE